MLRLIIMLEILKSSFCNLFVVVLIFMSDFLRTIQEAKSGIKDFITKITEM